MAASETAPKPAGSGPVLLRRIPTWAWLTVIVVASAIFRAVLGHGLVAPFIMVDELIWSELARGLVDAGQPLLRGEPESGYSLVYPLLISPAYAVFDSLPGAYGAVKTVNAVVMSLAAIPAYFLARRLMSDGLALLAALLTVAIPSLAYTGTVMTENVFYPLFLVVALVLVLVLERPTLLRVVLLLVLLGLAFATRVQAVALAPAALLAPLLLAVFEPLPLRSTLSRFRWLYGLVLGLALIVLAAAARPGLSSARTRRSETARTMSARRSATSGGTPPSSRSTSSSCPSPRRSSSSAASARSTVACRPSSLPPSPSSCASCSWLRPSRRRSPTGSRSGTSSTWPRSSASRSSRG